MSAAPAGLDLSKRTLTFALGDAADPTDVVTIRNLSDDPHYFKVKTTNPHRYIVRPNVGLVPAHAAVDVTVALHAVAAAAATAAATSPPSSPLPANGDVPVPGPSRDKFLVQSAPATFPAVSAPDFWASPDIANATASKLRVTYVAGASANRRPSAPLNARDSVKTTSSTTSAMTSITASTNGATSNGPSNGTNDARTPADAEQRSILPDADVLLRPGNAQAARARVEELQRDLDARAKHLAARRTDLNETRAETSKVLTEAPRAPVAANPIASDPFGGISIAAIAIFILLFAVLIMLVF